MTIRIKCGIKDKRQLEPSGQSVNANVNEGKSEEHDRTLNAVCCGNTIQNNGSHRKQPKQKRNSKHIKPTMANI